MGTTLFTTAKLKPSSYNIIVQVSWLVENHKLVHLQTLTGWPTVCEAYCLISVCRPFICAAYFVCKNNNGHKSAHKPTASIGNIVLTENCNCYEMYQCNKKRTQRSLGGEIIKNFLWDAKPPGNLLRYKFQTIQR